MRRRGWSYREKQLLIEKYHASTIKELEELFPNRTRDSINSEIKRLKATGKISGGRTDEAKRRSYQQRTREV